jgi:hypothetical protein
MQSEAAGRNHAPAKCARAKTHIVMASPRRLFDVAQACSVAHAELEVQRVRATIAASIAQSFAGGDLEDRRTALVVSEKAAAPLPVPEEETGRMAEAIRRALPILRVLDRYERRAIARRDNVTTTCLETCKDDMSGRNANRPNEPNFM